MELSKKGLDIIKKYEGCRLTAYKPVPTEKYYTIGYGHYGPDVTKGMRITQEQAEAYLKEDCAGAVKAVNKIEKNFNQNQFDALVSFTYNCGEGSLKMLCANRSVETIGDKIVLYNKAGGKVLQGLVRRRAEEQALYKSPVKKEAKKEEKKEQKKEPAKKDSAKVTFIKGVQRSCGAKVDGIAGNETLSKTITISTKINRKHAVVKYIQTYLNHLGYKCGKADGIAGSKFESAVKKFQKDNGCTADGEITARAKTWRKLLGLK